MEVFTYNDYITCIHTMRLNSISKLEEQQERYNLEINTQKKNENNIYNNTINRILKSRNEIAGVLNDFIDSKRKLKGKDIEKYNNLSEFYEIYKLKNKDVFYLIKNQSEIDNNMPYKVINACVDIIYEWNNIVKIKNDIEFPIVIPIIIYTGQEKWNVISDFSDIQVNDYRFENNKGDFKYNLIDINEYSSEDLIQKNSLFSYTLALRKARNLEKFKNILNQILISSKGKKTLQKKFLRILLTELENNKESFKFDILEIRKEIIKYLMKNKKLEDLT